MAIVGVAIGIAFFSAFIIGPLISKYFNLSGYFILIVLTYYLSLLLMSIYKIKSNNLNKQFKFGLKELLI